MTGSIPLSRSDTWCATGRWYIPRIAWFISFRLIAPVPSSSICMLVPRCSSMDMVDTGRKCTAVPGVSTNDRQGSSLCVRRDLPPPESLGWVWLPCHGCKLGYAYVGYVPRQRCKGAGHDFGSTLIAFSGSRILDFASPCRPVPASRPL